jgi:glycosyltransferase involved in cell wall biosynthesis
MAALALEKNLSRQHFDVIHYVFPFYGEQINFSGGKVLSCQDTRLETTLLKNPFFVKALWGNGYFDIASDRIKSILVARTGIQDDRRLRVNPCSFIDYSRTFVSSKEPIVTFVGNFHQVKNPTLFIEVIEKVHNQFPGFRAVMLGNGVLEQVVQRMISAKGLQEVIDVSYNPHPEALLSRSMVYMSIQNQDNYHSQALMEAMACGCAIVASDVGETYRLVSENVGFREPLDVQALSEKVTWLLKHPDAAAAMGKEARKKVMTEQTVERFSAYLERLYEDAAGS